MHENVYKQNMLIFQEICALANGFGRRKFFHDANDKILPGKHERMFELPAFDAH